MSLSTLQHNGMKYDQNKRKSDGWKKRVFYLVLFSMLGSLMYVSQLIMAALPNIHLIGMFTVSLTIVFRSRALIPIYLFVALSGLGCGFNYLWTPYLYVWAILWALSMLIPRSAPKWLLCVICPMLCSLHGFLFGALSAPIIALISGFDLDAMIAWIIAGFPFDIPHGIGNAVAGLLIVPFAELMKNLLKKSSF